MRTVIVIAAVRGMLDCIDNHSTYNLCDESVEVILFKDEGITLENASLNIDKGESFMFINDFEKYKKRSKRNCRNTDGD